MTAEKVKYIGYYLTDSTLAQIVNTPDRELFMQVDFEHLKIDFIARKRGDTTFNAREFYGHERTWKVPIMGKVDAKTLLNEAIPIIEKVVQGYTSYWTGANSIAKFTPDAHDALMELDLVVSEFQPKETADRLCSAEEWLETNPIPFPSGDEKLEAIVMEIRADAHNYGYHIYDDIEAYLRDGLEDERYP